MSGSNADGKGKQPLKDSDVASRQEGLLKKLQDDSGKFLVVHGTKDTKPPMYAMLAVCKPVS